tara:strand:- start:28162 stop:29055 length:894 start_codon:yes stop_codon:yes gene_type:complete
MSGYLLQLARRSLGISHRARSRATLPYATAATRAPMEEGLAPTFEPGLSQPDTNGSSTPDRDTARAQTMTPAPHMADAAPTPQPLLPSPAPRAAALQHAALAKADTPGPGERENRPAPERQRAQPTRSGATPAADSTPAFDAPFTDAPHRTPPAALAPPEARQPQSEVQPAATPLRAGSSRDLDSLIERLVSPASQPTPAAQDEAEPTANDAVPTRSVPARAAGSAVRPAAASERLRSEAQPRKPADDTDAAPEVHITIGRLEINPPQRPAPPPPQRRGPAPLSLADYLARRQGGGS